MHEASCQTSLAFHHSPTFPDPKHGPTIPCLCHDGPYRPPHPVGLWKGLPKNMNWQAQTWHSTALLCYLSQRDSTWSTLHSTAYCHCITYTVKKWPFQSDDWTGQNWRPSEPRICWTMFAAILIGSLPFLWVKITRELVTSWLKLAEICIKTYQVHD